MKVGLCLPMFRTDTETALDVADRAEAAGLDGVFTFDHLFPAGQPHRPALSALPVLAAVATRTSRVRIGPLVSRVGLLPLIVQVRALTTVQQLSGGRLIAGLGAGDSRSKPENEAFGLGTLTLEERIGWLTELARMVRAEGIEVWIGGNSSRVRALAASEADAWNCWNCPPAELAASAGGPGAAPPPSQCTWGGPPPADGDLAGQLAGLAATGAAWAIYGPPPSVEWPSFVAQLAGAAEVVH